MLIILCLLSYAPDKSGHFLSYAQDKTGRARKFDNTSVLEAPDRNHLHTIMAGVSHIAAGKDEQQIRKP